MPCCSLIALTAASLLLATISLAAAQDSDGLHQLPARRLLASVTRSSSAKKLTDTLVDPTAFTVLGGSKKPKFTGSAVAAGIVTWAASGETSEWNTFFKNPIVAFSTGDLKDDLNPNYDPAKQSLPKYPDITNSHIPNSHDAVVLDFWVKAKKAGQLRVGAIVATNEGPQAAAALHKAGVDPDDRFYFEVNGVDLAKLSDSTHISAFRLLVSDDRNNAPGNQLNFWVAVSLRELVVKTGQELRIKIRLADVGDRLVNTVAYFGQKTLRVR